jgi:hypothetical protein
MRLARTVGVFAVLIVLVCAISALALVPSYIIARQEYQNMRTQITTLNQVLDEGPEQHGALALRDARDRLALAKEVAGRGTRMSEALATILAAPETITLAGFSYTRSTGGKGQFIVSGVTDGRENLAGYVDTLRASTQFESVEVPIATVARTGGAFSVTVRGTF